jgi:hypothetical protein
MIAVYVLCNADAYAQEKFRTITETIQTMIRQSDAVVATQNKPRLSLVGPTQVISGSSASCPNQHALDLFDHEIAYERTEESYPLKGLSMLHVSVWTNDSITAFYIHDQLSGFVPDVRMTYVFSDRYLGRNTCPVAQDWEECIVKSADIDRAAHAPQTCTTNVDLSAISPWAPSANNDAKRKIAGELRSEIEGNWKGAEEIVVRDFNLRDSQITAYIKMPDGDYFQGCAFQASAMPHCSGWHLFGQVPDSKIRTWIFDKPYRLK